MFEQFEVGGRSSVLLPEGLILVDAGGQRATTAEHRQPAGVAIRSRAIGLAEEDALVREGIDRWRVSAWSAQAIVKAAHPAVEVIDHQHQDVVLLCFLSPEGQLAGCGEGAKAQQGGH